MNDTEKLQAWINQQRIDAGVTQEEIASSLGLSQAHVSRLLSGSAVLTFEVYIQLCKRIKIDPVAGLQNFLNTDPNLLN